MIKIVILFIITVSAYETDNRFKGCYQNTAIQNSAPLKFLRIEECVDNCKSRYYRYAFRKSDGLCSCANYLGEEVTIATECGDLVNLDSVYATGQYVPGPPRRLSIKNVSDIRILLTWESPESYTEISYYRISTTVIHTYAHFIPNNNEYTYPNNSFRTGISTLPATKYNITLRAVSPEGPGGIISAIVQTKLGEPDNVPDGPTIVSRSGAKMEVKVSETINNNGPITSYLVIVINKDINQIFQEELLGSLDDSRKNGINYYITAELSPMDIDRNFLIGDGHYYGRYYNSPLDRNTNYDIIIGITSKLNGDMKRTFSILNSYQKETVHRTIEVENDSPPVLVIGLSIAIGLLSFVLVGGIIGFIILKSKITNRTHRLSDNQELTLQGPMIEIENSGYIVDEECSKVNHYTKLKQQLKTIPPHQLKINSNDIVGAGRFGRVNSASLYENDVKPVLAYNIADKKLSPEDKKSMLLDLDVLIKSTQHENIISLIGASETPEMLFIVLEYVPMNLKDLLLGSRDSLPGRFSNMSETQALDIAIDICKGMAHLSSKNIVHKQLCSRNIMIANGFVPKISGYGLCQYYKRHNMMDYTRWTALEVLKGQPNNTKSDTWSFGCLLWEICVLGGTPYGSFANNEIPGEIMKGLRLPQLQYFGDELYQIMLDCWQIDTDERPTFSQLATSLADLKQNNLIHYLSFNMYSSFQYEQFYPDMELAVRAVF